MLFQTCMIFLFLWSEKQSYLADLFHVPWGKIQVSNNIKVTRCGIFWVNFPFNSFHFWVNRLFKIKLLVLEEMLVVLHTRKVIAVATVLAGGNSRRGEKSSMPVGGSVCV